MKRIRHILSLTALAVVLASPASAGETISGAVQSITESWVTIDGQTYKLPKNTEIASWFGDPIDPATVATGAQVELQLDDRGEPLRVRVMVPR